MYWIWYCQTYHLENKWPIFHAHFIMCIVCCTHVDINGKLWPLLRPLLQDGVATAPEAIMIGTKNELLSDYVIISFHCSIYHNCVLTYERSVATGHGPASAEESMISTMILTITRCFTSSGRHFWQSRLHLSVDQYGPWQCQCSPATAPAVMCCGQVSQVVILVNSNQWMTDKWKHLACCTLFAWICKYLLQHLSCTVYCTVQHL